MSIVLLQILTVVLSERVVLCHLHFLAQCLFTLEKFLSHITTFSTLCQSCQMHVVAAMGTA